MASAWAMALAAHCISVVGTCYVSQTVCNVIYIYLYVYMLAEPRVLVLFISPFIFPLLCPRRFQRHNLKFRGSDRYHFG